MEKISIFLFVVMGLSIYFLYRNERTYRLRIRILDDMRAIANKSPTRKTLNKLMKMQDKYRDISYYKILYSFKSFKKWDIEFRKHIGLKLRN